ncbi:sialate O-acetylesterase [Pseudobacteroides cellulosolvens]|uniref:Sialate O-acetylesterase n=1 Tax=Pseudobacteroides cellulosolvens ATCC 35603 = DSM 2933 TaxID=398512 RepID=A0A0L6JVG7_9FIRM|nr:sialate O-acetylesterase [Pseudobacteroides cellulosolvens]KNY29823.1 Sialate O-acetylesterase [Pseudobacteroides cellulosolvens ATCC 35603 = DSM 2933]
MKLMRKISVLMVFVLVFSIADMGSLDTVDAYLDKPFINSMFADHMVLQRDVENPVWGWTTPGEKVSVEIDGITYTCMAGTDGKWMTKIGPFPKGGPYDMKVTASQTATIKDILFGEVWFCTGQSNIVLQLREALNPTTEIQNANYPNIRFFNVPYGYAGTPQDKFSYPDQCKWQACSPTTAQNQTAVGYFFARKLSAELDVPVGIILSAVGGTKIEYWMSRDILQTFPDYTQELANLQVNSNSLTGLYNGMIAPVLPYRIKGTIWYQGEGSTENDYKYNKLLPSLIKDWRDKFGIGDFPFLIIQLPNISALQSAPAQNGSWTLIREAQLQTAQNDSNNGLIVTIDIGDANNVHCPNKQDVGMRSALYALGKVYGKNVVPSGPIYKAMTKEGNKIRVTFDYTGSGLMVGQKTGLDPVKMVPGGVLKGFAIAGSDKKFVWADAVIEDDSIVLSSSSVSAPEAVRYSWSDNPIGNLYNKEGFPASPFRTDIDNRLAVIDGTGSGTYKPGDEISLSAATPPSGKKFERWIGDTSGLDNAYGANAKLTMPAAYQCIKANFIDINATIIPPSPTPTAAKEYAVSGYVKPDFNFTQGAGELINSGFNVELEGTGFKDVTDSKGYFEIKGVPLNGVGYTLKISKPNYLSHEIKNVFVKGNVEVSSSTNPINIWAGDILKDGVQDNTINMVDIIEIARVFGSVAGDGKYIESYDFNMDNVINLNEVIIIARHFNATSSNYPDISLDK